MKILLASLAFEKESLYKQYPDSPYSLGLAYIYSMLERDGHDVKLLYLNGYDYSVCDDLFFNTLKEWRPDVVGLQIFSMNRTMSFRIIGKMQKVHPDIRIVIGGVHPSVMYEQIVKKYPGVIAVIGEGEHAMCELMDAFKSNCSLDNIKGLSFFSNGRVIVTPPRDLNNNLDELPFPKHEISFENEPRRTTAHIITSRGCPCNCSFCCVNIVAKRKVRKRSVNNVLEEIKFLKNRYPNIKTVHFHDDTLCLDNERVIQLCKMIVDSKLNLTFICSARVKPVSKEMFYWMGKAGFRKIMFGLETGSEKLLKSIHKNITHKDVINMFELIKPFKFVVTTFIMCGFPGETDETISETIDLVNKTQKIHYTWIASVGKLSVFPGTEVYGLMKSAGRINDDYWLTDNPIPLYTVEYSYDKLVEFEERIMNSISIDRILTYLGFRNHFIKMPFHILQYLIRSPEHMKAILKSKIVSMIISTFKLMRVAVERHDGKWLIKKAY